jgi:hypothetical protein
MKRYKTDMYEIYDRKFIQLRNESQILSGGNTRPGVHTILFDRNNLQGLKWELIGFKDGQYRHDEKWYNAKIPLLKNQLAAIEEKFQGYIEQQINAGYDEPENMPIEMFNAKLIIECRLDIAQEELAKVEERLKTFVDKEDHTSDDRVLRFGLMQSGRLQGGVLVELDGQRIGRNAEGLLIIADKRSIYHGLSVPEYRKLSVSWQVERKIDDAKYLEEYNDKARKEFKPLLRYYASFGGAKPVPKSLLPKWPEGVKNHYAKENVETK